MHFPSVFFPHMGHCNCCIRRVGIVGILDELESGNTRITKRSELTDVKAKVDFIEKHGRPAFEALPA